jgi:phosphoserine phosphatase
MTIANRPSERPPLLLDLGAEDLRSGLLGLVVALVEVVKEALRLQAVNRMERGSLTEEEVERLGQALMALEAALEQIKVELGITQSVKTVRDSLDRLVRDVVSTALTPPINSGAEEPWERP